MVLDTAEDFYVVEIALPHENIMRKQGRGMGRWDRENLKWCKEESSLQKDVCSWIVLRRKRE